MEVPDIEIYRTMQKVAGMEPLVKRVSEIIDNGEMDKRIEKAVSEGIKKCPFYAQQAAKGIIGKSVKWLILVLVPVIVTLLTVYSSQNYAAKVYDKMIETKIEEYLEE